MECLKCGDENPNHARFCSGCGSIMAAIKCDNCERGNEPGSRFCHACGHAFSEQFSKKSSSPQAERRLLTVLFCDLVNSTQLVDHFDPEFTRSVIRKFQALSKNAIEQMGGRITEYLGDGIVAQFTGQETNAESAINAALKINRELDQAAIKINPSGAKVKVRSGIATGLAVVGDMLGDERIRSESAVGLPLNLASRIQSLAQSGEVVIGETTHQLTHGLFQFENLGQYSLRGFEQPQKIWRVVAEQSISSRFVAHAAEMTPMVDRIEVMNELMTLWDASTHGEAGAALFLGEAGIGKSRIVQEFAEKISTDCVHVEYQCSPYHTNTALYPLISGVEAAARIEHTDRNRVRMKKLERLLRWSSEDVEHDMPAFLNLLSITSEDKWAMPNLDPDEIKAWIFRAVINHLKSLSRIKPLLIQVEDVHWIDPTTLELMTRLVEELVGHPILLIITARPGFSDDFTKHPHVVVIEVGKLPKEYRKRLIEKLNQDNGMLDSVLDEIIDRTEGIPLFMEELSKSLLERTKLGSSGEESSALAKKDIPTTLHDSLIARLDHLPTQSRSVAHLASVIGRDFSYNLLERIVPKEHKNLYELLSPLLEAQLVVQRKAPPNARFSFKHALVRDVAYETLLQTDRAKIHKNIAEKLEQDYPIVLARNPELIAHHFTEAKAYEKAVYYWLSAGKIAGQKFALSESREHLATGQGYLSKLADSDKKTLTELEYLITLGPVLMALEGPAAEVTKENYSNAIALCNKTPESTMHFTAYWGQWYILMDYNQGQGVGWADRLQQLAEKLGEDGLKLQAHHCQWATSFHHANFEKACDHMREGIRLYDIDLHHGHSAMYGGHDPKVCALTFLSGIYWLQGKFNQAEIEIEKSIAFTKRLDHTGSRLHSIELGLLLSHYQHNTETAQKLTEELAEICESTELPEYKGKLMCCQGIIFTLKGDLEQGIEHLKNGLQELNSIGTTEDVPVYTEYLAYALGLANKAKEGLSYLDDLFFDLESQQLRYWHSELLRQKGELLALIGETRQARSIFVESLEMAENSGALALALRTLISLYRFNRKTGLYPQALEQLNSVVTRIGEEQSASELEDARMILKKARN